MSYGSISILIPIFVILVASFTKRIISAITIGILIGGIFLENGNVLKGIVTATNYLVKAVTNEESICTVMFLFVFGAFGEIIKVAGGIKGFTNFAKKYVKSEKGALGSVWISSLFTFIDCCFHAISSGMIGKALIDKVGGNKYRLAHVINVTSCLLIILIPFGTTYVGYIVSVISLALSKTNLNISPYSLFVQSIPFNFYAIIMTFISIGVTVFNFGFNNKSKIFKGNNNFKETENFSHHSHEECEFEEKASPRAINLIFPLILLIASTLFFFWYLGKDKESNFFNIIMNTEFEKAILISSILTLVVTCVFYLFQKIPLSEIESHFLSGGKDLIQPIIVLIMSWGLSSIIGELGFAEFITSKISSNLPEFLIPAIIFLIGCIVSYFIGSAWGTWSLLMPIALPLAVSTNSALPLIVGAVLAGGSLGDNASPLGETVILSSTVSEVPIMDHVRTQLPYSLSAIAISTLLFIVSAVIL